MGFPLFDPDIARRAFDAIAEAQRAGSIADLTRIIGTALKSLGFDHFLGASARHTPEGADVEILFGANHQAWEAHYQANDYARHDAVLREMMITGEPLFWSDLAGRGPVAPLGRKILNEARVFGLHNGFATPMINLDGSLTTVLAMGRDVDAGDPYLRASAHMLSMYYASIARRLRRRPGADQTPIHLTNRQLECLKWVRDGKSSSDIGQILGLSSRTVDDYIAHACVRLNVRSRFQAVTEAYLHGLLDL